MEANSPEGLPEENKEILRSPKSEDFFQDRSKEDEDDDEGSGDDRNLDENIQNYFDLDDQVAKLQSYKTMINKVNSTLQIKEERDYRVNYILKKLVSRQKRRYVQDGFDLDLTYITTNIIAMGYPCSSLDRMYRNSMSEVQRFFKTKHPGHYKIYNLCSERKYHPSSFEKVNAEFTFSDHNPPPFSLILRFCKDLHQYLTEDPRNVAGIHCKAGKGRTGIMICSYLLYCHMFEKAADALIYYGLSRTKNSRGLTIPSQIRYVYYFEHMLNLKRESMPVKKARIGKIRMITIPMINMSGGCEPHFCIRCGETEYYTQNDVRPRALHPDDDSIYEIKLPKPPEVKEDVLVECYNKGLVGKGEKIFQFWFNTSFVGEDGVLIIHKNMLDKAYHDKENKRFDKNFRIELEMCHEQDLDDKELHEKETKFIQRLLKLTKEMPLVYTKLPLF